MSKNVAVFPGNPDLWKRVARALDLDEEAKVRRFIIDVQTGEAAKVYVELFAHEEVFEEDVLDALLKGAEIYSNEPRDVDVEAEAEEQDVTAQDCNLCSKRIGVSPYCIIDGEEAKTHRGTDGPLIVHALCYRAWRRQTGRPIPEEPA